MKFYLCYANNFRPEILTITRVDHFFFLSSSSFSSFSFLTITVVFLLRFDKISPLQESLLPLLGHLITKEIRFAAPLGVRVHVPVTAERDNIFWFSSSDSCKQKETNKPYHI